MSLQLVTCHVNSLNQRIEGHILLDASNNQLYKEKKSAKLDNFSHLNFYKWWANLKSVSKTIQVRLLITFSHDGCIELCSKWANQRWGLDCYMTTCIPTDFAILPHDRKSDCWLLLLGLVLIPYNIASTLNLF